VQQTLSWERHFVLVELVSRYLVQQRLEGVVVLAIDQCQVHRSVAERLECTDADEPGAQDHDMRFSAMLAFRWRCPKDVTCTRGSLSSDRRGARSLRMGTDVTGRDTGREGVPAVLTDIVACPR
jgi:hypothetical protein